MKTIKKFIFWQQHCYQNVEKKLEKYAAKGLCLKKFRGSFGTFEKTQPQQLTYAITFFSEGSIFNPDYTDNQLTYFEYAKASGWDFVCENDQIQIFSSALENPVPLETDEKEKLENIHRYKKKGFVLPMFMMLLCSILNLVMRIPSIFVTPTFILASKLQLATIFMMVMLAIFSGYTLLDYYSWYKKSKKSVELGGEILNSKSKVKSIFEMGYAVLLSLVAIYMTIQMLHWQLIVLTLGMAPVILIVLYGMIALQKKLRVKAKVNKIVTYVSLWLMVILYMVFFVFTCLKLNLSESADKDVIPLTCQDLFGEIEFENYSYVENIEQTFLLKKVECSQDALATKENPPEIQYTVYSSSITWVKEQVLQQLLMEDDYVLDPPSDKTNAEIFDAEKVYVSSPQEEQEEEYIEKYIIIYDNEIILLSGNRQFDEVQKEIIKEKMKLITDKI